MDVDFNTKKWGLTKKAADGCQEANRDQSGVGAELWKLPCPGLFSPSAFILLLRGLAFDAKFGDGASQEPLF